MRYTVMFRWGKKLIRMLLGDEDKFILHDRIDDLLAFTPEANSRIEKYLKSIVSVNIASTEHVSDEQLSTLGQDCIDSLVERLQDHLVGDRDNLLKEGRLDIAGFQRRLNQRWATPLGLLELFISLATDAGSSFNSNFRPDAALKHDVAFEALTRLHARACQISSEVLVLLRHGYADGAHARWRSIHEISIVSVMIREHGNDLAERYLLHDTVQRYKLACAHQEYHERIGHDPIPAEDIERLKAERDELVDRFGCAFKRPYGWAAEAIGNPRPTIRDLEEHAGIDHMRPYYMMASDNVHANAHASLYRLGLGLSQLGGDTLLAGPSNMGLADPGHSTALSLGQITINLIGTQPGMCSSLTASLFLKLQDRVGSEFLKVHRAIDAGAPGSAA